MSFLRQYIRFFLDERVSTHAFGEFPVEYDIYRVVEECDSLKEEIDIVGQNMELAYFCESLGEVQGAAWISKNENKFNFVVITTEDSSDSIFESLVYDCMEEYMVLREGNPELSLAVEVDDDETEGYLSEVYGLSIINSSEDVAIMGYKS